MKKKTPAARRTTTRRTPKTPPLTDLHLAALLLFLRGHCPSDVAPDQDIADLANRIIAAAPASLTCQLGHPNVFHSLTDSVLANYQGAGKDSRSEATLLSEILSCGDKDITDTDSITAFNVLVRCVDDAAVLGACLMYRLLKGGVQ